MYTLRARSGSSNTKQTTIEFRCRKRRQSARSKDQANTNNENSFSPPKRTKGTRSDTKTPAGCRSPLKEQNVAPEEQGEEECCMSTSTKTPAARVAVKRLEFSELTSLQEVKRSFHNSIPSNLLCRDEELTTLSDFLQTSITARQPGALYISGAPGTGKTACLSHIMTTSEELLKPVRVVMVNCMTVKQPQAVFSQIAEKLMGGTARVRSVQDALVKFITTSRKMILVVLDEIDQLDCKSQEILYTLFEWPSLPNSRLVLIGIANALDLTDRILPRLQSHVRCRPQLLHFPPYSKDQIVTILQGRITGECGETQTVIDPMAVQFCARKVAAVHGDLRKALDICRRAIELVETQERCRRRKQTNESSQAEPPSKPLRVTLSHIASVISEVYSSTVSSCSAQESIPLQQKLVACTLLLLVRSQPKKEVTLGKLHEAYTEVCRKRRLKFESETEFVGLCKMLDSTGIISLKKAKETRLMKVTLKLEESELEHFLHDQTLMSSVLDHRN